MRGREVGLEVGLLVTRRSENKREEARRVFFLCGEVIYYA